MATPPHNIVLSPPKLYSPVNVPGSPLSSQQGQLTGIPRKIRDCAADLFNAIQEWNRIHISGMEIINQIMAYKLDKLETADDDVTYSRKLQGLCENLETIISQLTSVVSKLQTVLKNFEAIKELEEMKKIMRPFFISWTAEKYVLTAKSVYEAYSKEALLKTQVKENIAHVKTTEDIMLYCAIWAHQPYVDNNMNLLIEAMLKETGHR